MNIVVTAQDYTLASPDGNLKLDINVKNGLDINVRYYNQPIISNISTGLELRPKVKTLNLENVIMSKTTHEKVAVNDPVPVKFSNSVFEYQQLLLAFEGNVKCLIRASNQGFAYRWVLNFKDSIEVNNEVLSFDMAENDISYFPKEESFVSHYEREYLKERLDTIPVHDFCSLPLLFQKTSGASVLITDADLYNYPAMFISKANNVAGFKAIFPKVVFEIQENPRQVDRYEIVKKEAEYIAKVKGDFRLPWRVFAVAGSDKELVLNNMVYQLSRPSQLEDIDWVKPGKVAWDWWNDNNIYGVDFKSGINTETYKYYIDFAAEYGLEYIILDEGWSKTTTDVLHCQPDVDVPALIQYGKEKGVGIILWTLWKPLDKDMDAILDLYESWGVKGIKVDFMQRADQYMVQYYERVAKEAAKRHLLVDFHGAFKPAGLRRAYPNIVNYEGLKGQENVKWSTVMTPEHNLTLPFTRMVAGPMDYTPGAMDNAHEGNFAIRWHRPMSIGTRCHQVAMYVIYEAPLQMLCDNPSNYYREKETTAFIAQIPTVWDETIVLDAKIGEYILMARRNGDIWYLGGMTVDAKEIQVDLSFLGEKSYQMQMMNDGINAERNAQDYSLVSNNVNKATTLNVSMSKGGGFAAIIK